MKKKRRLKSKVRMLLTFIVAIVLFGYVSFSVINYGISKKKFEAEESVLQSKLYELKDEETNLNQEITKLKDDDYLARYAREEYLYSKEGEYVIKIDEKVEENETAAPSNIKGPEYVALLNIIIITIAVVGLAVICLKIKKIPKKKVSVA